MADSMTHERCSELLVAYVAGELAEHDRSAVTGHLESCAECARERDAVRALTGSPVDPLTEDERAGLRRALDLERELSGLGDAALPRARWRARLAPALGAAALVGLLAVGVAYLGGRTGGDGGAVAPAAGEDQADHDAGAKAGAGAEALEATVGGEAAPAVGGRARNYGVTGPIFVADSGAMGPGELQRHGHSDEFVGFSRTFDVEGWAADRDAYLEQLALSTGDPALEQQVRECAQIVFESNDYAVVPVFATSARLDDEDVLVMGFVWSERSRGRLYKFMFWAWPEGDCNAVPTAYEAGHVHRGRR